MENLIKKLEKFKNSFKKDSSEKEFINDIFELKKEVECALNSFNETTHPDYVDIAIMNLNLAKKKYDLKLKEIRDLSEVKKAI